MRLCTTVLQILVVMLLGVLTACQPPPEANNFYLLELDVADLATELAAGNVSAEMVTRATLDRITLIDDDGPTLNAIIEINPDALMIARELDAQLNRDGPMGPLHGVPVVLKANIDTGDRMATTAGSLALADHRAADDAELVRLLREAGAIIVAKANMSEWANFRSTNSSSGWSSLGGQTRNPYVLNRNPCGSSSGSAVAVAAGLVPLAVGTETDGSIVCPAGANGVVGIKPTSGSVSQDGIIPISHTQDIAGPMARTVQGAAMMLAILQGQPGNSALFELTRVNLAGIRLGVLRDYFGAGEFQDVETLYTEWLSLFEEEGAELVDPLNLELPESVDGAEFQVLLFEFKEDLNSYLSDTGTRNLSLNDLITFNTSNADTVMPYFGQELFEAAQATTGLDSPEYSEALMKSGDVMRDNLDKVFSNLTLDAIIAPVNSPAWVTDWVAGDHYGLASSSLAAVSGYPSITVPGGLVHGLPVGIALIGRPGSEELLIEIAARFETARGLFPAPSFIPTLEQ